MKLLIFQRVILVFAMGISTCTSVSYARSCARYRAKKISNREVIAIFNDASPLKVLQYEIEKRRREVETALERCCAALDAFCTSAQEYVEFLAQNANEKMQNMGTSLQESFQNLKDLQTRFEPWCHAENKRIKNILNNSTVYGYASKQSGPIVRLDPSISVILMGMEKKMEYTYTTILEKLFKMDGNNPNFTRKHQTIVEAFEKILQFIKTMEAEMVKTLLTVEQSRLLDLNAEKMRPFVEAMEADATRRRAIPSISAVSNPSS